jgi:peptidyl-prolyl cis-trans isomerase B (cyclophilin B)
MVRSNDKRKATFLAAALALLVAVIAVIVIPRGGDENSDSAEVLDRPANVVSKGEVASVAFETSEGDFRVALDTRRAPKTANSFAYLAEEGFYDGLTFHRIVPGFVIQGGDPKGDGTGGAGYRIVERPPSDLEYRPGVVAMAKGGSDPPGSSESQFFIVTGPGAAELPPEYALVGEVVQGFDVVQEIGRLGGPDEAPTKEVLIDRATLERG